MVAHWTHFAAPHHLPTHTRTHGLPAQAAQFGVELLGSGFKSVAELSLATQGTLADRKQLLSAALQKAFQVWAHGRGSGLGSGLGSGSGSGLRGGR